MSYFGSACSSTPDEASTSRPLIILTLIAVVAYVTGCSSPPAQLPSPEEQLEAARRDMKKNRLELAQETLEELKQATAGTRLGGEVQFLLAFSQFCQITYIDNLFTLYQLPLLQGPESPLAKVIWFEFEHPSLFLLFCAGKAPSPS